MRTFVRRSLLACLLLAAAACGGSGASTSETTPRPRARNDLITLDELSRVQWQNAYDLINSLRPNWLRSRGVTTIEGAPTEIQVVLDDVRLGGLTSLRGLPVSGITFIQWFDGISASSRWGLDFSSGAIYI